MPSLGKRSINVSLCIDSLSDYLLCRCQVLRVLGTRGEQAHQVAALTKYISVNENAQYVINNIK